MSCMEKTCVSIVEAKEDNILSILELCKEMHSETLYRSIKIDNSKLKNFIFRHIECPESIFLLVFSGEKLVGIFLAALDHYFFSNEFLAQDLIFFFKKEVRGRGIASRIVSKYVDWCEKKNVREACLSTSTGIVPETVSAIYEKMGFLRVGFIHKKFID